MSEANTKATMKAVANLGEYAGENEHENSKPVGKRVRIILDDSEDIPPTGHPVSVNGVMYILRSGEEMDVPEEVVHVLELAITSIPVFGADSKVAGYRDRPRLPFRVIRRGV